MIITSMAKSRIRYNRSRTLLTVIAVALTTALLMAIGSSAVGMLDYSKQQAAAQSNAHATLRNIDGKQLSKLSRHVDVEAITANEIFATVEYGKMKGFLTDREEIKPGITHGTGNLIEGHMPRKANEICGPQAFFERMGAAPKVGETMKICFRVNGEGAIQEREFVICGLVSQVDTSKIKVSDSRIAYSASISEALVNEFAEEVQRDYQAEVRVYGEKELDYEEIKAKIEAVGEDIGCSKDDINFNGEYLVVMTDPGTETAALVSVLALIIAIFSGLVIYSIYYVGVITDVQEIGRLKAVGASKKQIKKLLLREGMFITVIAMPVGLLIGYLLPRLLLPVVVRMGEKISISVAEIDHFRIFSLPIMLLVIAVVLLTVVLSLLKPMQMASKISPIEAIRYQESAAGKKSRKGSLNVGVMGICRANLARNKKRTAITMITMGLSCVLFMSFSGVLNSTRAEDIADRELQGSDFKITIECEANDKEYPEHNLDQVQKQGLLDQSVQKRIQRIDGVKRVVPVSQLLAGSDYNAEIFQDGNRVTISPITREQAEAYQREDPIGRIDYDRMVAENGMIYTGKSVLDESNLAIGDQIELVVYAGDKKIPLSTTVCAAIDVSTAYFLIPQEVYDRLDFSVDDTTDLYIDVEQDHYSVVKSALSNLCDSSEFLILYARDEEEALGALSVNLVKYPMYGILLMIAVISFMNLINTMITSIITRKREFGMLQAIGLSDRQFTKLLTGEGLVVTAGTLLASVTIGNLLAYLVFLWAKKSGFMSVTAYHYPVWETIVLAMVLLLGQLAVTYCVGRRVKRESIIERIRNAE